MKSVFLGGVAVAAIGAAMAAGTDRAFAQSTETQRIEAIEKENAAMRLRVRRLEAQTENAALRARLDRLDPQGRTAPRAAGTIAEPIPVPPRSGSPADTGAAMQDYAADLPLKAPPRVAPIFFWTGPYLGVNAGYSVGNDRESQNFTVVPPVNAVFTSFTDSFVVPKGVIGGAQFGYNWQGSANWLAGVEADIQASNQKDTVCGVLCAFEISSGFTETLETTIKQELLYFGTFRGRVGFVNHGVLFYGTAGGAWGQVRETTGLTAISVSTPPNTPSTLVSGQFTKDLFGWAAGGGIEGDIGNNWTAKVEYLYMDLGSTTNVISGTFFNTPTVSAPFTLTTNSAIRDHIIRVGLNYHVAGGSAGPGVAYAQGGGGLQDYAADRSVMPVWYSWTGPYVGVNVGYSSGNDRASATWAEGGTNPFTIGPTDEAAVTPKGVLGGAQIGYNW